MNTYALLSLITFLLYIQAGAWVLFKDHRAKTHLIFALLSALFGVYSLGNFLYFNTTSLEKVYLYDRLAAVGWVFFPLISVWFFIELTQIKNKTIRWIFLLFQIPAAVFIFVLVITSLEQFKYFYEFEGTWYYTPNDTEPAYYLNILYLISSVLIVFFLLIRWYYVAELNKHRIQAKMLIITVLCFFTISFISNIIFPLIGSQLTPGLANITAIILIGGGTYTLVFLQGKVFSSDLIYKLLINHIKEFLFLMDKNGRIYATNFFTLSNLNYNNYDFLKGDSTSVFSSYDKIIDLLRKMDDKIISPQIQVDLVARKGKKIPVMLSIIKILGTYDSIHGYVLVGVDYRQKLKLREEVAERVRTEKNLFQIRHELEFMVMKRTKELEEANQKLQYEAMERRRAEQQIKADLDEKIELVKEVHHRVKNNIQMIISLINRLCNHPKIDKYASDKLRTIAEKVRYISRIHEDLYSNPNLSSIAFSGYLKKTIGELYTNYGGGQELIFKLKIANESLEIDQAIPLGIIFNELMFNVFKYAFNGLETTDKKKIVTVEFYRKEEQYSLIVSDNGVGLPENVEEIKYNKTGLQLVDILTKEHLKGEINKYGTFGTTFMITFNGQSV